MTIKQFRTAAKAQVDNEEATGEPLEVDIDGRAVTLLPPTAGQLGLALTGNSDMASTPENIASSINLFFGILEDHDAKFFRRRLFDRADPFDIDQIAAILEYAMEEWYGRPTKQPSDFLPSQHSTGKKSTAKRHRQVASTPSR